MTKILTQKYKTYLSMTLHDAVRDNDNAFYFYTGVHGDVIGEVPVPNNDERETAFDAYRNMIFGKLVEASDVAVVVRNIPWVADTIFAMYDDDDNDIYTKDFFCYVDEGSFLHVYKCLDNNFDTPSTVEPQFTWVTEGSNYTFQTSDGYVWKYMYSFTDVQHERFTTQNYIPVFSNTIVSDAAVPGALDVIHIEQNNLEIPGGGKKYDNYVAGTFATNQLRINGNNFLYAISNANINYTTGFYTGCLLYLSGGTGVGQYSNVVNYFTNANGNFIVIDTEFVVGPTNGTTFEIYPNIKIKGSGTETINATARALVNSTGSNSIYKIEMLEKGSKYTYATAEVVANDVITEDTNFIAAELRPIYGPAIGHGKTPALELGSDGVEFTMSFADDETGTLLTENRYQQIGLLRDPKFANVNIEMTNTVGTFAQDELVSKFTLRRINANVAISEDSTTILGEMSTLSNVSISSIGTAGSYIPDDTLTIEGGTFVVPAKLRVLTTTVRSVTVNAAGSGYTPGSFTANLNLGSATTNAIFTVTANSIGQCNSIIITNPGVYDENPPFLANSTPVGGSPGTGLTVSIAMGLDTVQIFSGGAYAVLPTDLTDNEPLSNVGDGAGAEALIAFTATLSADFETQVEVGDFIYITAADHTSQMLATVNSITNATSLEITTNGLFSCTSALMYFPTKDTTGTLLLVANATNILLANVDGTLATGDLLIGETSSAKAQVNVITRNDVTKNLHSFIQLYKYDVGVLSGDFIENEFVYQGNSFTNATATALLHSVVNGAMYTSNQVGTFVSTAFVQGVNSLAIASINESYSPELEFGSGRVLYIENLDPVERANNRTEVLQILLTFNEPTSD